MKRMQSINLKRKMSIGGVVLPFPIKEDKTTKKSSPKKSIRRRSTGNKILTKSKSQESSDTASGIFLNISKKLNSKKPK